jgi:hypothetical protein
MKFERVSVFALLTGLSLLSACGGRSDKYVGGTAGDMSEAGTGGSSAGVGGAHTGGASGAGGASTSGGTGAGGGTTGGTGFDGGSGGTAGNAASGGTGVDGGSGGTAHGGAGGNAGTAPGGRGGSAGTGVAGNGVSGAGSGGRQICSAIDEAYPTALQDARACDPNAPTDECTQKINAGLVCGCDSWANPKNTDAIALLSELAQNYQDARCEYGVECGACLEPVRGHCSDAGICEDVEKGPGRSCKVAGVVYADGEANIPDPTSCNTCTCTDGQLACTDIGGCDKPCPDGFSFGTDCAYCGPTDGCLIPEYDCFKQCGDGCTDPGALCFSGVCVTGICG